MKKQSKSKKQKSVKNNTDGNVAEPFQATRLPKFRQLQFVVPDKMYTRLTWNGVQTLIVAIGNSTTSIRFSPTSAYDIDPLLGSTSAPGFAEMAALYNSYRVPRSTITTQFSNSDARTITAVVIPLNSDPTGGPSAATIRSWVGNPYSKYRMVPGTGSPPTKIVTTMSTEKIFGSKAVYFDDNFASLVTTVPANNWWWAIGIVTPFAVATTNMLVNVLVKIEIDVEFFNRKELLA